MDIGNISSKNLMEGKLDTLLQEIETQVKNKNFAAVENCVAALAKIGENLVIKQNADGTRVATVKAKDGNVTEDIDFMTVLQKLKEKFETKGILVKGGEVKALKIFRANVETTLGTLLKENEITQELLARGVSDRDIIDNGENEIKRSQAKVDKLKPLLQAHQETKALFGEDSYIETAKKWDSKSKISQIEHANMAKEKLDKVNKKLKDMKDYAEALGSLDSADKAANQAEIAKLLSEVKVLKTEISDLQINGLDLSALNRINEHDAQNIDTKIANVNAMLVTLDTSKNDAMKEMRQIIEDNKDKFSAYMPSGVKTTSLTEEQLKEIVNKIDKDIDMYAAEIKFEETYQTKMRESVDRYKDASEKSRNLRAKYPERPVLESIPKFVIRTATQSVTNPDGSITEEPKKDSVGKVIQAIYEYDETINDYKLRKEFTKHLDEKNGQLEAAVKNEIGENWKNETVEVDRGKKERYASDATREEILRADGIADEDAYINNARENAKRAEETAIATLSVLRKRQLIREAYRAEGGLFHPIKFLRSQFAPNLMWENEYKAAYLAPKVAQAEQEAEETAKKELDDKVASAAKPELDEYKHAESTTRVARDYANRELSKAVSRNRVLYNVEIGTDKEDIKQSAVRAAVVTGLSMEDIYIKCINGEITDEEFHRQIGEVKKRKESIQARAYTDDVRNPQQGHKDTFKDEER